MRNPFYESIFTIRHATYDNGVRVSAAQDKPIPGIQGTRVREYYDQDGKFPIHPGTTPKPPGEEPDLD